jgi:hypothetical protein
VIVGVGDGFGLGVKFFSLDCSLWVGRKSVSYTEKGRGDMGDGGTYEDLESESVGWLVIRCFLSGLGVFGDAMNLLVIS